MPARFLSKSKYLAGTQCPKLLWFHYNAREELPDTDEDVRALLEEGRRVGEVARRLFPGGILIRGDAGFQDILEQSLLALDQRRPLFEAGFRHRDVFARADILAPVPRSDTWDIVEVKMTTEVKDIHHHDLALQRHCYEGAGVPIRRCFLLHINSD
jgi:hypothetical protein